MKIYIVERRRGYAEIEDSNCFIGSSMDKIIEWINRNKDFDKRDFYWYWVILKGSVDEDLCPELFKVFDWDGVELDEQPLDYSQKYNKINNTTKIKKIIMRLIVSPFKYKYEYTSPFGEEWCVYRVWFGFIPIEHISMLYGGIDKENDVDKYVKHLNSY